jgi:RNA polymerase-binding protein DksA
LAYDLRLYTLKLSLRGKTMNKKNIETLAQLLRNQRQHFLGEFRRAEEHLGLIGEERESEIEERAQEERSARLLASLDDRTLLAVREIDAALQRLLAGSYGHCEACRKKIPIARLRALPATRFCKDCAGQRETRALGSPEEGIAFTGPQPSGRLALLDEAEWAEAVDEQPMEE